MKECLQFGGTISKRSNTVIGIAGAVILMGVWILVTQFGLISPGILPSPINVVKVVPELLFGYNLLGNIAKTVGLNLAGYAIALVIAIPIGFLIGIYPIANALFRKYFEALRYLPLPTVSGIFISIFGLGAGMKASFLAFGIMIFALPSVIGKVMDLQNPSNEKDYVYIQTAKTLGMTNWQMFRYVYWPYTMEGVYNDIRSLVAISYTYVVIAESINKVGGIGAMISTFTRQSRMAEIYALLFIIVLVGITQDFIFKKLDPVFFKHHK